MGNWKAAFVCALIAFILVLVTLFGAWFSVSGESEAMGVTSKVSVDMGLRDMTMTTETMGVEATDTTSYSDMSESSFIDVFNLTQILVILALVFTLLMFVFALLVGMGKTSSKIGVIFGALALIFVLITFVYFMVATPAAMEEDSSWWVLDPRHQLTLLRRTQKHLHRRCTSHLRPRLRHPQLRHRLNHLLRSGQQGP